jgi:flagellar biosynthesis protein FlhF
MKLTRVEASSMQEALGKIREALGDDAMIVGTRTFRRGGMLGLGGRDVVEVYVADNRSRAGMARREAPVRDRDELPAAAAVEAPLPGEPDVASLTRELGSLREEIQSLAAAGRRREAFDHPFLREAFNLLVSLDVEPALAERIVWELKSVRLPVGVIDPQRVRALLKVQISRLFPPSVATGIPPDNKVLALIGPTGVGKTTTIAKLAARAKINERKNVALITLDTFRIAAVDQLEKYARIIGNPLQVVSDPVELAAAVMSFRQEGMDLILVDSAGRGQRDELKMRELEEFIAALPDAEIHLVLSATTQPRTLLSVAERFAPLGCHRLILTKIDETESFGSLVAPLAAIGKPVSYLTDGQNVPDDILSSDPDRLAELVFRGGRS